MAGMQDSVPKLVTVETRLLEETVARLKAEAQKQRRSVASLIRVTLEDMLEEAA